MYVGLPSTAPVFVRTNFGSALCVALVTPKSSTFGTTSAAIVDGEEDVARLVAWNEASDVRLFEPGRDERPRTTPLHRGGRCWTARVR